MNTLSKQLKRYISQRCTEQHMTGLNTWESTYRNEVEYMDGTTGAVVEIHETTRWYDDQGTARTSSRLVTMRPVL